MTFGLTPTGFVKKTLPDILSAVETKQTTDNQELDVSSDSPIGQLNGIFCGELAEAWDALESVYKSQDPDAATGDALDAVCALTGTKRDAAEKSKALCTVNLNAGTTLLAGSLISIPGNPTVQFSFDGPDFTNATGSSASFTGQVFHCTVTGPVVANAGTLTQIATPIAGWNSVTNPLDATVGADIEKDPPLRMKRQSELFTAGTSPVDALKADLEELAGMIQVTVFENTLDTTDGNGVPPHAVECLVYDGDTPSISNDVIAQKIWDSRAGGIATFGNTSGTAIDSDGVSRIMNFSRPALVPIYLIIDLTPGSPYGGDPAVKSSVVAYGRTLGAGDDVILSALYPSVFAVTGVTKITSVKAGLFPSPAGTADLVIASRSRATFDTSRISIV